MRVELRQISKSFGAVRANDDVSLTLQAGSIHGLLGENGAGKSTLAGILSGLVRRDAGAVLLDGKPMEGGDPARALAAGVGMLHQEPHDFPELTVLESFAAARPGPFWFLGKRRREVRDRFFELRQRFGFTIHPEERVGRLSMGERQQLELLGLLSLGVRTLILDEPTTGISDEQRDALFGALKQLAKDGCSILLVSHKLPDVLALCDRVSILRQGKLVGEAELPITADRLVEMMFGSSAAARPEKPAGVAREKVAVRLERALVARGRLQLAMNDFTAHEGEIVGLAGLEGSGQALLLQLCAGLLPVKGDARLVVGDASLAGLPYRDFLRAGVSYVPADRAREGLIGGFTIEEHVALRAPAQGLFLRAKETLEAAERAIETFRIRGRPGTRAEQLSGGNQQRTQLALLPAQLKLLLMEHPTRGLDIESTQWVWQQLIARCKTGTAIVFASSDLDELLTYSDRVIVFSGGHASRPVRAAELSMDRLGRMIGGHLEEAS
ncbi:ATP-binding cassette domain-containing protein [Pendulispora brunnea]|uniref:ATP-binding cassette domain-containing protein n=1 Tax=Pendulispora brunnea TaxID=2905690 RepID=A0ABZ2KFJ4_9BACT